MEQVYSYISGTQGIKKKKKGTQGVNATPFCASNLALVLKHLVWTEPKL